jgi:hypothetical protein
MVRPRGEINILCLNEKCRYYLKEDGKDIGKRGKVLPKNKLVNFMM